MIIRDMFAKPIDRDIKGVIKVGQGDDSNIRQKNTLSQESSRSISEAFSKAIRTA